MTQELLRHAGILESSGHPVEATELRGLATAWRARGVPEIVGGWPEAENTEVVCRHPDGFAYYPFKSLLINKKSVQRRLGVKENQILFLLALNPNITIPLVEFNEKVYGRHDDYSNSPALRNAIFQIRKKLQSISINPAIIVTYAGIGFRLTDPSKTPKEVDLKSPQQESEPIYHHSRFVYRPASSSVQTPAGKVIHLSPQENRFLEILAQNPGRIVPHNNIATILWQDTEGPQNEPAVIRQIAWQVRRKIEPESPRDKPQIVVGVRGQGYKLGSRPAS